MFNIWKNLLLEMIENLTHLTVWTVQFCSQGLSGFSSRGRAKGLLASDARNFQSFDNLILTAPHSTIYLPARSFSSVWLLVWQYSMSSFLDCDKILSNSLRKSFPFHHARWLCLGSQKPPQLLIHSQYPYANNYFSLCLCLSATKRSSLVKM